MKTFARIFAPLLLLFGCAPGPIPVSDAASTKLDPNAVYGFYTLDSEDLAVGMENLCRNFDETEFILVTYRIEDPCGGFDNRIIFGVNPFLPDDISRLIRLSDGTLVGIFKMLEAAAPAFSGLASGLPGTYIQRNLDPSQAENDVVEQSFAIYELKRGVIQYLGHKARGKPLTWRETEGLAALLSAAVPGLEEDQVEVDARVKDWTCIFQPVYLVSGGSWTCRSPG